MNVNTYCKVIAAIEKKESFEKIDISLVCTVNMLLPPAAGYLSLAQRPEAGGSEPGSSSTSTSKVCRYIYCRDMRAVSIIPSKSQQESQSSLMLAPAAPQQPVAQTVWVCKHCWSEASAVRLPVLADECSWAEQLLHHLYHDPCLANMHQH